MSLVRKFYSNSVKIYGAIIVSLTISTPVSADNVAIIGGIDLNTMGAPPYAALVSSSGQLTPLDLGVVQTITGTIQSVSMNSSGISLIGGQNSGTTGAPAYAALISSSGDVTPLAIAGPPAMHGIINSVAINNSGNGIIGGRDTQGPIYAALVPPSGNPLMTLTFPPQVTAGAIIYSVAINDSGNCLVGGKAFFNAQPAYAAFVDSSGNVNSITLAGGIATSGTINSVSINSSGNGIIGGQDQSGLPGSQPAYAALISSSGTLSPLTFTGDMAISGPINTVAINDSGNGIIGGQDQVSQAAYAALVSSSGALVPLTLTGGVATNGIINSVAVNFAGNGIIGGQDLTGGQPGYAALVSSSGAVVPLTLTGGGMATNGIIYSVAINSTGNGIIGGWDLTGSQPAYAALFTSSGVVTPLTLTGGIATTGIINSVAWMESAILPLLAGIPTSSLSCNNLRFANYINEFAPDLAFYFIPAELDGTLNAALQSAAPTRNAFSIYTASNNLFFLMTSLSTHLHNHPWQNQNVFSGYIADLEESKTGELTASISATPPRRRQPVQKYANLCDDKNSTVWFEAIGALAYQKSQSQTPGFNPATAGAILSFDHKITEKLLVGGGLAYLYTHIHEKQNAGHSNINQEEAFIYSSWDNQRFYIDTLLMGGAVQINQVRNIKMTGFAFRSTSHPKGWQLLPHLEVGYKKNWYNACKTSSFCPNVFVMLDWANAWQESYKEKGSGPFNAAQKSYYGSLLRTEAGFRFYETFFFDSWNFTIQEKISYVNTQSFNAGKVKAFLVGSPGAFTVETLSSAQNLGVAQLAMSFDPRSDGYPITTLFYQGEFGSKYQSHQLNLELAWQF